MCYITGMNSGASEPREVPVDILPPLPRDAQTPASTAGEQPMAPLAGYRTFYHPASGVAIIAVDLLGFGPEMLSGFLDTPIVCVLSFLVTFPIVFLIQLKWSRDHAGASFGKAFLGAFLPGFPSRSPARSSAWRCWPSRACLIIRLRRSSG